MKSMWQTNQSKTLRQGKYYQSNKVINQQTDSDDQELAHQSATFMHGKVSDLNIYKNMNQQTRAQI